MLFYFKKKFLICSYRMYVIFMTQELREMALHENIKM